MGHGRRREGGREKEREKEGGNGGIGRVENRDIIMEAGEKMVGIQNGIKRQQPARGGSHVKRQHRSRGARV